MNIAYIDCFSGIAGDMMLGALLDLGLSLDSIVNEYKKLPITGYTVRSVKEKRGAIAGTRVIIECEKQPERSFRDIRELLSASELEARIKEQCLAVFERLAEAESRVHHIPAAAVHFHEVGAVDSLLDIVGTVAAVEHLQLDRFYSSPVPTGGGFVKTEHGLLPVPAPATVVILEGVPVYNPGICRELVTPTGAALLTHFAKEYGTFPEMTVGACGYGVGAHPASSPPNLLRIITGVSRNSFETTRLLQLDTNIDDMSPEIFGFVLEKLIAMGALDVTLTPVQMKKNRPGIVLSVLMEPSLENSILDFIFSETTTLGVRLHEVRRVQLRRRVAVFDTPLGSCSVKEIELPDGGRRLVPEYESCREIAERTGTPILNVYDALAVFLSTR